MRFILLQIAAATRIQGCYRKRAAKADKLFRLLQYRERIFSTIQIQRVLRGFWGRQDAQRQRLDTKRRELDATLAKR